MQNGSLVEKDSVSSRTLRQIQPLSFGLKLVDVVVMLVRSPEESMGTLELERQIFSSLGPGEHPEKQGSQFILEATIVSGLIKDLHSAVMPRVDTGGGERPLAVNGRKEHSSKRSPSSRHRSYYCTISCRRPQEHECGRSQYGYPC